MVNLNEVAIFVIDFTSYPHPCSLAITPSVLLTLCAVVCSQGYKCRVRNLECDALQER